MYDFSCLPPSPVLFLPSPSLWYYWEKDQEGCRFLFFFFFSEVLNSVECFFIIIFFITYPLPAHGLSRQYHVKQKWLISYDNLVLRNLVHQVIAVLNGLQMLPSTFYFNLIFPWSFLASVGNFFFFPFQIVIWFHELSLGSVALKISSVNYRDALRQLIRSWDRSGQYL